jgi:hypothetical protein
VRGKGAFNAIRPVAIEGVDQALWSVDVSPGSSGVPEGAQYAVMLGAQYLAQQGGGRLAGEMSGDQVEMQLHIPRADTDEAILKSWPLQPEIAGRIVDEILHVIADGMRKGSQKLDQALSEEIDRLANEKVDLEALGNLRKSLDKLRETERLFDDYWRALL